MNRRDFLGGASAGVVIGTVAGYGLATNNKRIVMPAAKPAVRELRLITSWAKETPGVGPASERLAKRITDAAAGQLVVKVLAPGEVAPATGSFDAVSSGAAEMYFGPEYYWQAKSKAYNFFASIPLGLTAVELGAWIRFGGGQALWDELSAGFNIKPILAGNSGAQMGGWYTKEIHSVEDLRGLRIRMQGIGGEVMRRLGAVVAALPGGEILGALESGSIDAAEWIGPWGDLTFGFYKVAKNYYFPGFHEPCTAVTLGINKKLWDELTPEQRNVIELSATAENDTLHAEFTANNADALETLVGQHQVQLRRFPDSVLSAIVKVSEEVLAELAAGDDITKRIHESYAAFRRKAAAWSQVSDRAYLDFRGGTLPSG
ncbi:MAG: TRAP transporter substrate-binding protein [Alphaproteobacteria bacterium]